ncbi:uncharacterized protein ACOB8E_009837 [Sarcophilus harrisii]
MLHLSGEGEGARRLRPTLREPPGRAPNPYRAYRYHSTAAVTLRPRPRGDGVTETAGRSPLPRSGTERHIHLTAAAAALAATAAHRDDEMPDGQTEQENSFPSRILKMLSGSIRPTTVEMGKDGECRMVLDRAFYLVLHLQTYSGKKQHVQFSESSDTPCCSLNKIIHLLERLTGSDAK